MGCISVQIAAPPVAALYRLKRKLTGPTWGTPALSNKRPCCDSKLGTAPELVWAAATTPSEMQSDVKTLNLRAMTGLLELRIKL